MSESEKKADQEFPHGWPDKLPETIEQAVDILLTVLSEKDKKYIRKQINKGNEDLDVYHFSIGMWIRNNFGLWSGNKALNKAITELIDLNSDSDLDSDLDSDFDFYFGLDEDLDELKLDKETDELNSDEDDFSLEPDQASSIILKKLWERFKNSPD